MLCSPLLSGLSATPVTPFPITSPTPVINPFPTPPLTSLTLTSRSDTQALLSEQATTPRQYVLHVLLNTLQYRPEPAGEGDKWKVNGSGGKKVAEVTG